jgi:CRP/FNR family cyclic AMP-dependent transcriptional regulator
MPDEELLAFLSRTPFFGGLERTALERAASMLEPRSVPAGGIVFREGDQGSSMFVVRSGEVLVCHEGAPGEPPVRLTRLREGDFFGEMTLIEMQPRSATVQADSPVELLELRARALYDLYKQDVRAYVMVLQNVNRELCRRLRRTSERLVEWASSGQDPTTQVSLKRLPQE